MTFVVCAVFRAMLPAHLLRRRVIPLLFFSCSLEFRPALPAAAYKRRSPSLGFLFSFAISVLGVHLPMGFPHPPTFRPQCFAHSRRFPPPHTLRVCFVPLPRPRFIFRGFPRQPAGRAFTRAYPLVVDAACGISPSGFCPIADPSTCFGFTLHGSRSPLDVPASSGSFSMHLASAFTSLRSRPLSPVSLCENGTGPQRINRCTAFPPVSSESYPFKLCGL